MKHPPVFREVAYLSPSSLRMLEERPVEFYLRRMGPSEGAPAAGRSSGFAAEVGIAFDAHAKARVAKERSLRCPSLEFMLKEVVDPGAREMGEVLLRGYEACGALGRLLEERPQGVAVDGEDYVPGTKVPVRTRIDAWTTYLDKPTIHDWKVTGAARPGTASPTPGYTRIWDTDKLGVGGPHEKYQNPFEWVDSDWAAQLAAYGWAMGFGLADAVASVDQVVVWKKTYMPGGQMLAPPFYRLRVAQFRSTITKGFQEALVRRYEDAWQRIKEERVVPEALWDLSPDDLKVFM